MFLNKITLVKPGNVLVTFKLFIPKALKVVTRKDINLYSSIISENIVKLMSPLYFAPHVKISKDFVLHTKLAYFYSLIYKFFDPTICALKHTN